MRYLADDSAEPGFYPLSWEQKALWLRHEVDPHDASYNIFGAAWIESTLDVEALRRSLQAVADRHPGLRTTFGATPEGEPFQEAHRALPAEILVEDAAGWSDAAVTARLAEIAHRPFDLRRNGPLRAAVLTRPGDRSALLLALPHIAADLWSLGALLLDLGALHRQEITGIPAALPPPRASYAGHVRRQEEMLAGPEGERHWAYWRAQLDGEPPLLALPLDRPRPPIPRSRGAAVTFSLGRDLTEAAKAVGRRRGAPLYTVLLTAFEALLARISGQEDFLVGTVTAGRPSGDWLGVVGYFVRTLALRTPVPPEATFEELLRHTQQVVTEGFEHQDYPLPLLLQRLPSLTAGRRAPFQVMYSFQKIHPRHPRILAAIAVNDEGTLHDLGGLALRSIALERRTALFDLELLASEGRDGLHAWLVYEADLFDGSTARRLAERLRTLLAAALAAPDLAVADLPLLGPEERQQLTGEWNDTGRPWPDAPFLQLFAATVARDPDGPAVRSSQGELSYRQLDLRSSRLARLLDEAGGRGQVVALLAERGCDFLTAMLGVFKVGGAYLPLDPRHPARRHAEILARSAAPLVLVTRALLPLLETTAEPPLQARLLILDELDLDGGSALPPAVDSESGDLAYVIYTSGSTGAPKGAMIDQRGMVNHLFAKIEDLGLTSRDVVAQTASQCFDISVWQFLAALVVGGRTHVCEDEIAHDPLRLLREVQRSGVTILETVPSLMRLLVDEAETQGEAVRLPVLRWMVPTGEALPPELCRQWHARFPEIPLLNAYGPTECSDDVAHHRLSAPPPAGAAHVPIGRPVGNLRLYVLDRRLALAPAGVPGELWVGGAGVGRGYLRDPARTSEVFRPDPFSEIPGARLYKTGDLARWLPQGEIEFLGRIDHQVKIRGLRIELGEIEVALAAHPAVREALVLDREVAPGDRQLVAYIVPEREDPAGPEEEPGDEARDLRLSRLLGQALREQLPEYMVPSSFVVLDSFPLTPNGKVDRSALPAPRVAPVQAAAAALSPTGERLRRIWAEMLGVAAPGPDDSFFELGGHSLLATQMISRVRSELRVEIALRTFFDAPTLSALARHVEETEEARGDRALPIEPIPRQGELPLSFAQKRLWALHQMSPLDPAYNMTGAVLLSGDLVTAALEKSLEEVVRRHETLRTTFRTAGLEPVQVLSPPAPFHLPVVDLRGLPVLVRAQETERLVAATSEQPFDLERGPLLRVALLRQEDREHLLLVVLHHIISDGWSQGVLIREITALYGAWIAGRPSPLPALPIQYVDFACWQRQWLRGEVLEDLLGYWKRQLGGDPPVLELPTDFPRTPDRGSRGRRLVLPLDDRLMEEARELSRREGVSLYMTLLAAFEVLLHRYTRSEDLIVGSAIASRTRSELEGLIGFFVNMLALRIRPSGVMPFRTLLAQVRTVVLEASAHQDLPFERLVRELQVKRLPGHTPLFQVAFGLQNAPMAGLDLPGLEVRRLELAQEVVRYDLTVWVEEAGAGATAAWSYRTDLFTAETIRRMHGHFVTLLRSALAAPDTRIDALEMLTGEEKRHQQERQQKRSDSQRDRLRQIKARSTST